MQHAGILVVNRKDLLRRAEKSGTLSRRTPAINLAHEKIFHAYRGFDGQAWPELAHPAFETEDGLAALSAFGSVDAYLHALPQREEWEAIVLARPEDSGSVGGGWRPVGFDLGYFESEWSHFSVLLNEVIYGTDAHLRRFAEALNESLLVPSLEVARELIAKRSQLAAVGADLEEGNMEPMAIFIADREPL